MSSTSKQRKSSERFLKTVSLWTALADILRKEDGRHTPRKTVTVKPERSRSVTKREPRQRHASSCGGSVRSSASVKSFGSSFTEGSVSSAGSRRSGSRGGRRHSEKSLSPTSSCSQQSCSTFTTSSNHQERSRQGRLSTGSSVSFRSRRFGEHSSPLLDAGVVHRPSNKPVWFVPKTEPSIVKPVSILRSATPVLEEPKDSRESRDTFGSDVYRWFAAVGFEQYAAGFVREGWDDVDLLRAELMSADADRVLRTAGVLKSGHRAKIRYAAVDTAALLFGSKPSRQLPMPPPPPRLPARSPVTVPNAWAASPAPSQSVQRSMCLKFTLL
jgi:hypothetical protein